MGVNLKRFTDTDTIHISKQLFYNDLFQAKKEYPIIDLSLYDNIAEKIAVSNIHKAITIAGIKSLKSKGNEFAYALYYREEKPLSIEDLYGDVFLCILETVVKDDTTVSVKDNQIILSDALVLKCINCIYTKMSSVRATETHNRNLYIELEDGETIINARNVTALSYLVDFSNVEFNIEINFIYDEIGKLDKNAEDVKALFELRLSGYKFKEIVDITGLSKDRIKYCNRLLHKVGAKMGYNCNTYTYTNAQKCSRKRAKKIKD